MENYISENGFNYKSVGDGQPLVILHGLMGGLSHFEGLFDFFPKHGYAVIAPALPAYNSTLLNTNVKYFAKYVKKFIDHKKLKNIVLIGNSLGGHVGLIFSKLYPKLVKGLVLTGSSGLYENSMGDSYPKREDYNFIKKKTQEVFYSPDIATKEIVDAKTGNITPSVALITSDSKDNFSIKSDGLDRNLLFIFSKTTMASSTTTPINSSNANKVMIFKGYPKK